MLLVEGRKHWTFFSPQDLPALRPTYPFSFDPVFPPDILETTSARSVQVELRAGELLFVPANSPHAVHNLTTTVALSGNYIDESNIHCSLAALRREGLVCGRARELLAALEALERDPRQRGEARRRGDQETTFSWRDFKHINHHHTHHTHQTHAHRKNKKR